MRVLVSPMLNLQSDLTEGLFSMVWLYDKNILNIYDVLDPAENIATNNCGVFDN